MPKMSQCVVCGRDFHSSTTAYTVRCPEHRGKVSKVREIRTFAVLDPRGHSCTIQFASGNKCGAPAVNGFTSDGNDFYECAAHSSKVAS